MALPQWPHLPTSPVFAYTTALLILIGGLATSEFSHYLLQRELESRRHADALRFASSVRARIDRELNTVLYLSSGLASYLTVRHSSLDDEEINAILAQLYRDSHLVRNFGIAIGFRLRYVYPIKGNREALGLYYPDLPEQWPQVQRALSSNRGTLAGPLSLVQGGEGLIYRVPVTLNGQYWGLLSTVIDVPRLFDRVFAAGEEQASTDLGYDLAIRGRNGQGWQGDVFLGPETLFSDPGSITLEADVPNGTWILAARPNHPLPGRHFATIMRVMGGLLAVLLGFAALSLLRHRLDLAQQALFDPLTTLPNRRYLENDLKQRLEYPRSPSQSCGLLFVDLDGFKAINDHYGHKAGDIILKTVAERIGGMVGAEDTVARWGGDEIVVVINETDSADLKRLSERLRQTIESPIRHEGHTLQVGASIGCAQPPEDGLSARDLLKVADQRMYREKKRRQPVET